jgi:hypothetical protein
VGHAFLPVSLLFSVSSALSVNSVQIFFCASTSRMLGLPTPPHLPRHALHPPQLHFRLLHHQLEHPNRLMIPVPHLFQHRRKNLLRSQNLAPEKLLPPPQLQAHRRRPRLPGQRHPRQKRRPIAPRSPLLSLQCIRQCNPPLSRSLKAAPFRPCGWLIRFQSPQQPGPRQFLH